MAALILQFGLFLERGAEQADALLVDALRGEVGGLQLQCRPRLEYPVRASAKELKVESGGSRHGRGARGRDNQAATWPAAHLRHPILFKQANGLTEDRSADTEFQH
jgi:hypothetical protein